MVTVVMSSTDCTSYSITCSSAEALLWFNKGVFAYVSSRDVAVPSFLKTLELDSSVVLAHCVVVFKKLLDLKGPNDTEVSSHLSAVKQAVLDGSDKLTEREHAYVRAVEAYSSSGLLSLAKELVQMLYEYPLDILAIRMTRDAYNLLGEFVQQRDMIARALPFWSEDMEFYPYLLAFYAFALEECFERGSAERVAKKALAINKKTPLATHTLVHVIEETSDVSMGVELLTSTRDDWSGSLQGHISWHLTLFYLDLGDYDSLYREFDNEVSKSVASDNVLSLVDASSLLWRLNCLGIDPGENRWQIVLDGMAKHVYNDCHRSARLDKHIMMALAHGIVTEHPARLALAKGMLKAMENYSQNEGLLNCKPVKKLGIPVCNALLAFGMERYDEVLQTLMPLRYDFQKMGGSWAQRQVMNLTMIQAAINNNDLLVAFQLVAELKYQKPKSRWLETLFHKLQSAVIGSRGQSLSK